MRGWWCPRCVATSSENSRASTLGRVGPRRWPFIGSCSGRWRWRRSKCQSDPNAATAGPVHHSGHPSAVGAAPGTPLQPPAPTPGGPPVTLLELVGAAPGEAVEAKLREAVGAAPLEPVAAKPPEAIGTVPLGPVTPSAPGTSLQAPAPTPGGPPTVEGRHSTNRTVALLATETGMASKLHRENLQGHRMQPFEEGLS
jgi:hypothetical protein